MTDRPADSQELLYYRRRLDEVAGESLRLDHQISGLRIEIKQKRQAFDEEARGRLVALALPTGS